MKRHLLVAAIAIAAVLSARAQEEPLQIVEAPLSALGGDWELGALGGSPDLNATGAGKVLTFSWTDETGLADVEIQLEINWRHHRALPCLASLNGVSLGALDQPEVFLLAENVFYPTIHRLRIPAGAYAAHGLNTFALTTADGNAYASVGICEPPGRPVALRFLIQAGLSVEVKPPANTIPVIPQAIVLVDVSTGIIIQPGMIVVSVGVQIQAILADANGGQVVLQVEVQVVGAPFIGVPTAQSSTVPNGEVATVDLPAYDTGERRLQVRTVDEEGFASDWVALDTVFEASGGSTVVRSQAFLPAPQGGLVSMPAGDESSGGSCSAGASHGSAAALIGLGALILIGAACGRRV